MAAVTLTLRLSTKPRMGTCTRRAHAASRSAPMPSRSLPSTSASLGIAARSCGASSPEGCAATSSKPSSLQRARRPRDGSTVHARSTHFSAPAGHRGSREEPLAPLHRRGRTARRRPRRSARRRRRCADRAARRRGPGRSRAAGRCTRSGAGAAASITSGSRSPTTRAGSCLSTRSISVGSRSRPEITPGVLRRTVKLCPKVGTCAENGRFRASG